MSQYSYGTIDPDAKSGTQLATDLNQWRDALYSMHRGTARPTYAVAGLTWLNTTSSPYTINYFDGTNDIIQGYVDETGHVYMPVIGGGTGTIVASATTDIGSVKASHITINGSATIASFGSSMGVGQLRTLTFGNGLTLTHNGTQLNLPAGGDTVVSAGDRMIVVCTASGNYTVILHVRTGADTIEPPGIIKEYGGFNLPAGYLWADGSPQSRSTYANLFTALTKQTTGSITSGLKALTNTNIGVGVEAGMPISIAGAGAAGALLVALVTSATTNQINIDTAAGTTVSGAAVIVAPHGLGNGTTTFNVPDRTGRKGVGRDNLPGSAQGVAQVGASVTTTNGSGTLAVTPAGSVAIGMFVSHPNIPPNAQVSTVSADGLTITLSGGITAFASGAATGYFSPYQNANRVGAKGGSIFHYIALNELVPHPHPVTVTDPTHVHTATVTDPTHTHIYVSTQANQSANGAGNAMLGQLTTNSFASATGISVSVLGHSTGISAAATNNSSNYSPVNMADPGVITQYMVKT